MHKEVWLGNRNRASPASMSLPQPLCYTARMHNPIGAPSKVLYWLDVCENDFCSATVCHTLWASWGINTIHDTATVGLVVVPRYTHA